MQSTYLQDYATGEGLSEEEDEEDITNFVMFVSTTDPATFMKPKEMISGLKPWRLIWNQ